MSRSPPAASDSPCASPSGPPRTPLDFFIAAGLLAVTTLVFWPPVQWLASQAFAREQLKQSVILVALAGLWILWEKRHRLQLRLELSSRVVAWMAVSYALAAATLFLKTPLFVLGGIVAATAGVVRYVFGPSAFRRTLPLLSVFAVLIVCVLLFPILDWPLRQMAGLESARLLKSVGLASQLAVSTGADPRLFLITPQQTFVVATECNGFGLISSSLLLGLIRLLYLQAGWARFVLLLPVCVGVAFVFNFLRIAAIVLLAPRFPGNYDGLHEVAGLVALYSGLGVVWFLTTLRRPAAASPDS